MSYFPIPERERYRRDDPSRVGTVVTVTDPDTKQLMRCVECGDPVDILWEDVPRYVSGTAYKACSECRSDTWLQSHTVPTARQVQLRTEQRLQERAA